MPHLKEGATIINTTSVTAYRGSPELLDYSATKGAILAFTRSLVAEACREGNPRQRRRPRADLDAAHPVHFPGRESCKIRVRYADEAARTAQRSRAVFPVPRLRGFVLHDGCRAASERRRRDRGRDQTKGRPNGPPFSRGAGFNDAFCTRTGIGIGAGAAPGEPIQHDRGKQNPR